MKKAIVLLIVATNYVSAQITSPIDTNRSIDWTHAGIPGGIPNRTLVYTTISPGTYGNGAKDATIGIQTALNNCPENQVVYLSAGMYRINGSLQIPSNVTLRGAGPQKTVLKGYGSEQAMITFGTAVTPLEMNNSVPVTSGTNRGSKTISLSSASGIVVGSYLMITELNDTSFVSIDGGGGGTCDQGNCTWCDGGQGWNGTRTLGQIVEVTSVNGNSIGVSPSLYLTYKRTLSPLATAFTAGSKYAGVEDLQVYADSTGYGMNFFMSGCAYCWIKNVESNYADGDHVDAYYSYRCEIRDSYFHDAFLHTPGIYDSDILLAEKTSCCLLENNQFWRLHTSVMLNWGSAGNVIAYNYSSGNFDINSPNVTMMDFSMHGAHPMFNLYEGNVATSFHPDDIWGSSSDNTAFRNWFKGTTKICNPMSGRGLADTANSWWACQANRAVCIDAWSRKYNLVGNVVGSTDLLKVTYYNNGTRILPMTPMIIARSTRAYDDGTYGYSFGYAGGGGGDDGSCSGDTTIPFTTAFIHGNYNYANSSITWDPSVSNHSLPVSLYLSTKPSWFASTVWPLIGPDVKGYANKNPAEVCFEKGLMPTCLQSNPTGIQNNQTKDKGINVYPNPARDKIYFEVKGDLLKANVSVYSIDGKLISFQTLNFQTDNTIDVSGLSPGMYFVQAVTENFYSNQRIIIAR